MESELDQLAGEGQLKGAGNDQGLDKSHCLNRLSRINGVILTG